MEKKVEMLFYLWNTATKQVMGIEYEMPFVDAFMLLTTKSLKAISVTKPCKKNGTNPTGR